MADAATPAEQNGGTPPAAPAATPATVPQDNQVVLSKEEHEKLTKDAARASEAQSRADRFEGVLKRNGLLGGSGHFRPRPAAPAAPVKDDDAGAQEDAKAAAALTALALDPAYRAALDADPTLRELLIKNPLAVLPVLASDALDADDAVSLVKDALAKRKPAEPTPAVPAPTETTPPAPPAGAINPDSKPVNEQIEAARKNPNTEDALAGMIAARAKDTAGKK